MFISSIINDWPECKPVFCFIYYLVFCAVGRDFAQSVVCIQAFPYRFAAFVPRVNWSKSKNSRGQNVEKLFVRKLFVRERLLPNLPIVFNICFGQVPFFQCQMGKSLYTETSPSIDGAARKNTDCLQFMNWDVRINREKLYDKAQTASEFMRKQCRIRCIPSKAQSAILKLQKNCVQCLVCFVALITHHA